MTELNEQRHWYEDWHGKDRSGLPVETMKQSMRLFSLHSALRQIDYVHPLIIGCGQGDELSLVNATSIVAFDLSRKAVTNARRMAPPNYYLQADGMHLPFGDHLFDLVIASEVIEHILVPETMLSEIGRVLRPSGVLVLTTPNWISFFGLARWAGEILLRRPFTSDDQPVDRWRTPASLARLLYAAGFDVIGRRGAWYFPPTGVGMRRLPDRTMAAIFRQMLFAERWLQRALPGMGHMQIVTARRKP